MDIGSIIGIFLGMAVLIVSILIGADFDFTALMSFADAPSVLICIVGPIASLLVSYPLPVFISALKALRKVFQPPTLDPQAAIKNIIDLANLARKEGILALEETARNMDDKFLQKGVMLIVDGTDPELTRNILETEMSYIANRHAITKGVWQSWASFAPAWGMKGTVVGLVIMMNNLDDPDAIGPSMAVALLTTFYGSIMANWFCTPVSNKLKTYSQDEMLIKEVLIEGMLSIQAGENPRIIEEKLKSFLSPTLRTGSDGGGE